ncbi:HIT family protein [Candidatus Endowatersipora endosymbiont of Watersipora subatra]|uniref:HIT family protein n=1 Tax=Candidatus Endowatersipora endosymbiont of Watersipora subatra TaxID=3077946 RepID=UPI00312C78A6
MAISNHKTEYNQNNVFANILKGDLPSHQVYEDTITYVIMDIMPWSDGHCLVIPKTKARNILDVDPDILSETIKSVQIISKAVIKAFNADGVMIQQFNESAGGQVIFHLHFHIIPRFRGKRIQICNKEIADNKILAEQADKIRRTLREREKEFNI